jgi:hypothetical protein
MTHETKCIVCEKPCYCSNDSHTLGCGGKHGEGGCNNPPIIEFCSLGCAEELQRRLDASIAAAADIGTSDTAKTCGLLTTRDL